MADIELLPLPIPQCTYADHSYPAFKPQQMEAHSRACVEANIVPLRTEIEALRAEVEGLRAERMVVIENHAYWKARAERLAEALRHVERRLDWLCSERGSPARGKTAALIRELWSQVCRALAQEDRNG